MNRTNLFESISDGWLYGLAAAVVAVAYHSPKIISNDSLSYIMLLSLSSSMMSLLWAMSNAHF